VGQVRYLTRSVALQIKAATLGSLLQVYDETPSGEVVSLNDGQVVVEESKV